MGDDSSSSEEGFPPLERITRPIPQWPEKGTLKGQYKFPEHDEYGEMIFCFDTAQQKFSKQFFDQTPVKPTKKY